MKEVTEMSFFHREELKLLWPFYLDHIASTILFFTLPFQVAYFSSIGLSATKIGILLAVGPLMSLLFEIPTGAIADVYGRKFSVILGSMLTVIPYSLIIFFKSYSSLLVILGIIGITQTLLSGSLESWIVDHLRSNRKNHVIKEYFTKRMSLFNIAFAVSGVLGTFLVGIFGLGVIWPAAALSYLISGAILFIPREKFKRRKVKIKDSFIALYKQTKESISYGYNHHVVFYLLAMMLLFSLTIALSGFVSWTPLGKSLGLSDAGLGYLWSAMAIAGIFSPFLSRIVKRNNERKGLIILVLIAAIVGLAYAFVATLAVLLLLIVLDSLFSDSKWPIYNTYFHRHTPSKLRATVSSMNQMIFSIGSIIGLPITGFLVDHIGAKYTITISGVMMLVALVLCFMIRERK